MSIVKVLFLNINMKAERHKKTRTHLNSQQLVAHLDKLLWIAIVHNTAFMLFTQCFRQFEVHQTDMDNEVALYFARFLTARPLAAVGMQVEMHYFVILQHSNVTKSLLASHKGAAKLAVSGVEMIQCRLSSGSHSATLLDGAFKFALIVVAIEVVTQSVMVFQYFARVTLGTYQLGR